MQRHPYFQLWLHDDAELANLLGSPIIQRTTLHEWPLSCVQRLHCAAGQRYIYKVQAPPTVEPTFYRQAHSPLLVAAQILPSDHEPPALLLEDVQACSLLDLDVATLAAWTMVETILTQIAQIAGDLPTLSDIRSEEQWLVHGEAICTDLDVLVSTGTFQQVTPALIEQVALHSRSPSVMTAINGPTGYVHLDLQPENILVLADDYRVLDWQRPIWGPVALDQATLLEAVGLDPVMHVGVGILQLRTLLQIGWFAQAARYWFPAGAPTYDRSITELIHQLRPV